MPFFFEIPPTAGLSTLWRDWLPSRNDLSQYLSEHFTLPPVQLTCSGTAALVIALTTLASTFPARKEVIIPAYTCPLVVLAINHCGLKIKLCDLAIDDFDFNFTQLATLMNENTLAVIPTHLGGRVANVKQVKRLAEHHNIIVIEDAAQALGANVGHDGDIVFFSLAIGKGLTLYEGGLLTSRHPQLREALINTALSLTPSNLIREIKRTAELFGYTLLYNPFGLYFAYGRPKRKSLRHNQPIKAVGDEFSFNLPLHQVSQFRQRIASNSVTRLPDFIQKTTDQALHRIAQLQQIKPIKVIIDQPDQQGIWPFIMILLPSKQIRDAILHRLWQGPLGVSRLFIHALPDYQYLSKVVPASSVPNAQSFADKMLTISNSLWLNNTHFTTIFQTIIDTLSDSD